MDNLTFNEYQQKAMTIYMPTCNNIAYMMMILCGGSWRTSLQTCKSNLQG